MKRFFGLLLLVPLLGGIILVFLPETEHGDLLDFVPADSLLVLDWQHPADDFKRLIRSPPGQVLTGIDWPVILETAGVDRGDADLFLKGTAWIGRFSGSPFFNRILSHRTVIALFRPEKQQDPYSGRPIDLLRNNLVLLNSSGRSPILTDGLFGSGKGEDTVYQGITIHRNRLNSGETVYWSVVNELFAAALAPAPLKRSLDLRLERLLQKEKGIRTNREYDRLRKQAGGNGDCFFYLLPKAMARELLPASLAANYPAHAIRAVAFFHQQVLPVQQLTGIIVPERENLSVFQQNILSREPVENWKLANMPAALDIYFWSNWLDLPTWWRLNLADADEEKAERMQMFAGALLQYTGMDIEGFLHLFGNQVGLNIKEIRTSGFFPVPRVCFCVEIQDRDKMESLLSRYLEGLPQDHSPIAGTPVVSVLAAGGLMLPSYALLDRYLVLADSRDQIASILEPGEKLLVRDPDFLVSDMGLQQLNNLVLFARTARLLDGIKEFAAWTGTFLSVRNEQAGARSKILLDDAVIPLLDSLAVVRAQALRSYVREGKLVVRMSLLLVETNP